MWDRSLVLRASVALVCGICGCANNDEVPLEEDELLAEAAAAAAAPAAVEGPAELSWRSPAGTLLAYDVHLDETSGAAVKKFAGEYTVDARITVQLGETRDGLTPLIARVESYSSKLKDADGFEMTLDTRKPASESSDESMHAGLVELCGRGYPLAIGPRLQLYTFPGWSTSSSQSYSVSDQFERDIKFFFNQLLVPVDGGAPTAPRAWKVHSVWDELREDVPLILNYEIASVTDNGQVAALKLAGAGEQSQGGEPPYSVKIAFDANYQFHMAGRALSSASIVETMTTDDAFGTTRTRKLTIRLAETSKKPLTDEQRQSLAASEPELGTLHERSLTGD